MAILLGLGVALAYGGADFLGGRTARGNPTAVVVAGTQTVGLVLITAIVALDGAPLAGADSLLLGAASGLVGLCGVLLLYRGLALGAMGVIAPVTAVGAAVVPVAYGIATGERPSALALGGVVLALVAVALIAGGEAQPEGGTGSLPRTSVRELLLAGTAGAAFGVGFILLAEAGEGSGLWPVLAARSASVPVAFALVLAGRHRLRIALGSRGAVVAAGVLDVTAVALYLLASREGLISLVAAVGSLYPAGTVLLARLLLDEHLARRQVVGLGLALSGVVLIAA